MKKAIWTVALLGLFFVGNGRAQTQPQGQQTPPAFEEVAQRAWVGITGKIVAIAKDVPEDKWDYRPHKDSRSTIEELWHCMAFMQLVSARTRGQALDQAAIQKLFSNEGKPRARAEIVATMETAAKNVTASRANPLITSVEHLGEHYGKLATIYRVNGLVPPESRGK